MSFLLRRTRKAIAGWLDTFNRPDENPVRPPWGQWGDARTVALTGNAIQFGNDGGWLQPNPNGGLGYEHQPLTDTWVLEFDRTLTQGEGDGVHRVYLDQNWTAGTVAKNRYQIYLELNRDTDRKTEEDGTVTRTVRRRLYFQARDTQQAGQWFQESYGTTVTLSQAEWMNLSVRIVAFKDSDFYLYVNGSYRASAFIPNPNYRTGPGRRAASFTHLTGPTFKLTRFNTYDRPTLARPWTEVFYDDFQRASGTDVGNGWSQGGGQFGILNGALSMQSPFIPPSDGVRGIWRGGMPTGDMRVEVTLGGGGTGNLQTIAQSAMLLRVNDAGTHGLAAFFSDQGCQIYSFNSAIGTPEPSFFQLFSSTLLPRPIATGHKLAFCARGSDAWVEDANTGSILAFVENVDQHVSVSNTGYGAYIRRKTFFNSVPLGDLRAFSSI